MRRAAERLVCPAPPPSAPAPAPAGAPHAVEPGPQPEADSYVHPGGACRSWGGLARVCGAEALGSALLVLLAPPPGPLAPLHAGLVVALIIQCLGGVSGAQVNPCVSCCAWWAGRMRGTRLAAEVGAQLTGALLGAALHHTLLEGPRPAPLTLVAPGYPTYKAVLMEASATLCLALGNLSTWRHHLHRADTWPLRAAALLAALAVFAGDATGGSMNPARSFGPALYAAHWDRHWVYWVGPLAGTAAACVLHRLLGAPPPPPPPPAAARKPPPEP